MHVAHTAVEGLAHLSILLLVEALIGIDILLAFHSTGFESIVLLVHHVWLSLVVDGLDSLLRGSPRVGIASLCSES